MPGCSRRSTRPRSTRSRPQYRPSTGAWTGIAARSTVFAYNPTLLTADQLPASLLDLQNPEWKGRWAASPGGADFQAIVSALLALKGEAATEAWLAGMKTNFTAYQGNTTVMKAVNAGEIPGGVIYHYYWFGDQAKTGENSKNVDAALLQEAGPGGIRQHLGWRRPEVEQEPGGRPGAPEVHHRGRRPDDPADRDVVRVRHRQRRRGEPGARRRSIELEAPTIDPSTLDSKKVTDLMTQAGIL